VDRYTNEAKRLYGVMNKRLAKSKYIGGAEYSIADIADLSVAALWKNQGIDWNDFPHLKGWFDEIAARPAVMRGVEVLADCASPSRATSRANRCSARRSTDARHGGSCGPPPRIPGIAARSSTG
jgi:hypothetical protein